MKRVLFGLASLCLAWSGAAQAQVSGGGDQLPLQPIGAVNRFVGDENLDPYAVSPASYDGGYAYNNGGPSCTGPSCTGPSCTGPAPSCTSGVPACGWGHGWFGYGEALYLRNRGAEVPYAAVANGPFAGPVPGVPLLEFQRIGTVDMDYNLGFRAGVGKTIDCYSSISGQFTWYDANTDNQVTANQLNNLAVFPLVLDPGIQNAAAQYAIGAARLDLTYRLADLDYRFLALCCDTHELTFVAGMRYAQMTQAFDATFTNLGVQTVATNIDFTGYGARFGLEGERYLGCSGFFVSGKGYASFLAGEFNASYRANAVPGPGVEVDTDFQVGRMVSMLEMELGIGWRNCNDTIRIQGGYVFSSWYNMMLTKEWIQAVQDSNFVDPSTNFNGMTTFDGVTGRVEFRY